MAAEAKEVLESVGYTFHKRGEDGWWTMLDKDTVIAVNRSLGDLIRSQANIQGAW
jgi:hypothetical protein